MKVEATSTGAGSYTLTVELPAERVSSKLKEAFRQVARDVTIPGFRRGHVPRALLEAQFGKDFLHEDVQQQLIEETLPQALQQEGLRPVSSPQTKVVEFEEDKPFVYEASIEVLPEVAFPELSAVTVEEDPEPQPDAAAVDDVLEDLKLRHATLVPKGEGGVAEFEDVAVIQVGEQEPREIMLSEDSDLSKQLVGHKPGEAVQVTLEEQTLTLSLRDVKAVEKPDLEELAATLDEEDEAALRAKIQADLGEHLKEEHRRATRYKVLDALVAQSEVPVPPRLKQEAIEHELNQLERSGRYGSLSEDDRSAYAEGAAERLQREVAIEALKRQAPELKLSDEAFEQALEAEAAKREMNPVKFRALLERDEALGRFRGQLEDERALDYLVEHVNLVKPEAQEPEAKPKKAPAKSGAKGGKKAAPKKASGRAAGKKAPSSKTEKESES